jgi:hypothetical protein
MLQPASGETPIKVTFDEPIKLVVPNLIRSGAELPGGLNDFQLRFKDRVNGTLSLLIDGRSVWQKKALWRPESRIIVPRPTAVRHAQTIHFSFSRED